MRPVPISSTAWCKLVYSSFSFYTYTREKKSISLLHVNNKSKQNYCTPQMTNYPGNLLETLREARMH